MALNYNFFPVVVVHVFVGTLLFSASVLDNKWRIPFFFFNISHAGLINFSTKQQTSVQIFTVVVLFAGFA